ncbi:FAD-dependent oxidoreductase [Cnuibacter physcomitrellae]|uniref:oxidoreductase n=1 Tax=Cnuibacter physcomitrellae TaxID=1619308 RepID=UPI001C2BDA1B|nr:FAD-dependent oxidoreductase [Cnuibacter physcomitrellae]
MSAHLRRTFSPWRLGTIELPHRVIMGSMHAGLETLDDGGDALAAYYSERVRGGACLVITGGIAVSRQGSGALDFSVFGDPAGDARMARAVSAVHAAGGLIAAQLFHAGRYALLEGMTEPDGTPTRSVAPSPLPWRGARGAVPQELDEAGVLRVIDEFRLAAARAVQLGFDAVEIMGSEGYLINQFCSPVTNLREDEWGGDPARRRRFAVEVVRAVRRGVGRDVPVIMRMSGADLVPGSSTQEETDELARALVVAGADALNIGIGWHESTVPTVQAAVPHGVWLRYSEAIVSAICTLPEEHWVRDDEGRKGRSPVPVIASNRMNDLRDVEDVLGRRTVTAVALARPFLADASLVDHSREGRFDHVNTCIGCNQACLDRSFALAPVSCLVNPRAARESRYPVAVSLRTSSAARFAVVGGGPAGLVAASDLAGQGHRVTLFEASAELGGQFTLAARIPTKEDYALTVRHYESLLERQGVQIEVAHPAIVDELAEFDGVVVATGVRPRTIDVPGATLPHVLSYEEAIRGGVPSGPVVVIGGGGIGVDTAKFLVLSHDAVERGREFDARFALAAPETMLEGSAYPQRVRMRRPLVHHDPRPGSSVTVLRRRGKFGAGMGITSRWVALGELRDAGVRMLADLEYEEITPDGVRVRFGDGRSELLAASTVIVCAGQVSHDPLSAELAARGVRHEVVGGALDASGVDAVRATRQGLDAARRLPRPASVPAA